MNNSLQEIKDNNVLVINPMLKTSKKNKAGKHPINIRITKNGIRQELSTSIYILKKHWNSDIKRVSNKDPLYISYNRKIDDIIADIYADNIVKVKLQAYIIRNYNKISAKQIANTFNVSLQVVSGTIRTLRKQGKLPDKDIKPQKFINVNGKGKLLVRSKIKTLLMEGNKLYPSILSLPADNCILEESIVKDIKTAKFTLIEKDLDTFIELTKTILKKKLVKNIVSISQQSLKDVLPQYNSDSFNLMFMDYCGSLLMAHKDIDVVINNNLLKVEGCAVITLSYANRVNNTYFFKNLKSSLKLLLGDSISTKELSKFYMGNLLLNNPNYKLIDYVEYDDTSEMGVYFIKRIQ